MAKVLTLCDVNEILVECRANGQLTEYRDKSETLIYCPPVLGRGWTRDMQLRPGLTLDVSKNTTKFIYKNKVQQHPLDMPLTFKYYLTGGSRVNNNGLSGEVEEIAGKSYLYHLPKTGEIEQDMPGRHSHLCIRVAPELMYELCDRIDEFPTPLRKTLENPADSILYHPSPISPAQRQIIKQIFAWPYQGLARHLYLEGKVLELIALHLSQILNGSPQQTTSINPTDRERIYAARDILIQNAVTPPLLTELAQQVELSETKLTQGFRQVFNTSVFNYLQNYRLEQARQLLQTDSLNIQEVARSVGYTSFSSFTKAFKKKFKVPPSTYLKGS
ncbi:MAG: AraC family transcriptional regulator [Cyanobacteria bacterium P01_H01_bin.105]